MPPPRRGYGVVLAAGRGTFPPSADGESPAEVQRKRSRPVRANTLTQFARPGQPMQKRSRPVRANTPAAVRVPRTIGAEKEPPRQGEHADAVRVPRWVGAEKEPPRQGEHADAVRVPRWVGAENPGNPEKIFPPEKAAKTPVLTLRNGYPNGIVSKT